MYDLYAAAVWQFTWHQLRIPCFLGMNLTTYIPSATPGRYCTILLCTANREHRARQIIHCGNYLQKRLLSRNLEIYHAFLLDAERKEKSAEKAPRLVSFLLRGACVLHLRSVFRSIDCLPGRAGRAPLFSKSYAYTLLFFVLEMRSLSSLYLQ